MSPVVLLPLVEFLLKFVLYLAGMKVRKLPLQGMTAALCAGSSLLAGYVPISMLITFTLTIERQSVSSGQFLIDSMVSEKRQRV